MEKTVLIISNSADIHSDDLVMACSRQGVKCFRYNTDHFRIGGKLNFEVTKDCSLKLEPHHCHLPDVDLLIYRRPEPAHRKRKDIEPWLGSFLDKEWETLEEALSLLVRGKVMNPLSSSGLSQNKVVQLHIAKQFGLNVPKTLISNDIEELKNFAHDKNLISKGIHNSGYLYAGKMRGAATVNISLAEIEISSQVGCPTLLQEKIKAAAIWRIITVGEKTFGFRMTGDKLAGEPDSRVIEGELNGQYLTVPSPVKENLGAMCQHVGIIYASSDFIEDQNGDLWFIDLNPEGQWGAYEHRFNVPISDEIIKLAFGD